MKMVLSLHKKRSVGMSLNYVRPHKLRRFGKYEMIICWLNAIFFFIYQRIFLLVITDDDALVSMLSKSSNELLGADVANIMTSVLNSVSLFLALLFNSILFSQCKDNFFLILI